MEIKFLNYLSECRERQFFIDGYNMDTEKYVHIIAPYLNRWTTEYKNRLLAKLGQLDTWYQENRTATTMITFTTRQDGLSYDSQYELLQNSYRKLRELLTKRFGKFNYFWILEPHKSGYAHMHFMYFGRLSDSVYLYQGKKYKTSISDAKGFYRQVVQKGKLLIEGDKDYITRLWNEKYRAGGYARSVQFEFKKAQRHLQSVRNYLMKYVKKSLRDGLTDGALRFASVAWWMGRNPKKTGIRFWGCSRFLSQVMKKPLDYDAPLIHWMRVQMSGGSMDGALTLWASDDLEDQHLRLLDEARTAHFKSISFDLDAPPALF